MRTYIANTKRRTDNFTGTAFRMSIYITPLKSKTHDKSMCIHGKTICHALYHSAYTLVFINVLRMSSF